MEKDKLRFLLEHPGGLMELIKDQLNKDTQVDQTEGIDLDPKDPVGSQRLGVALKEVHWAEVQVNEVAEGWRWDIGHLEEIEILLDLARRPRVVIARRPARDEDKED